MEEKKEDICPLLSFSEEFPHTVCAKFNRPVYCPNNYMTCKTYLERKAIEERASKYLSEELKSESCYDAYIAGATEQQRVTENEFYEMSKEKCGAINLIDYLDEHRPKDKMCFSNMECEDLVSAFNKGDWAKVIRYIHKYEK